MIGNGYMECSCIYVDDNWGPSCFRKVDRKARKDHACTECGCVIRSGEKYRYESGIWDNIPASYKTCSDCLSIRDNFFCNGWIFSNVWSDLRDHVFEMRGQISEDCITSLPSKAKEKTIHIIQEYIEKH